MSLLLINFIDIAVTDCGTVFQEDSTILTPIKVNNIYIIFDILFCYWNGLNDFLGIIYYHKVKFYWLKRIKPMRNSIPI